MTFTQSILELQHCNAATPNLHSGTDPVCNFSSIPLADRILVRIFVADYTAILHSGTDPVCNFGKLERTNNNTIMPRKQREKSVTGIYHVMMRGINHQDIFEDRGDYWKFLKLLRMQTFPEDKQGKPLPPHLTVYAYCLMSNHVHLLVRELEEGLVPPIKSIAISYAQYFNYKYEHSGQLFQDRFKSEPVDDMGYFVTLLRYIHQNPIAAGICSTVDSYTWSSWCEYDVRRVCAVPVCTTGHVLNHIPIDELTELVNEPLPKAMSILDYSNEVDHRVSDDKARQLLSELLGTASVTAIQHLEKDERNAIISQLRALGASIRQISRLTGVSEGIVRNIR